MINEVLWHKSSVLAVLNLIGLNLISGDKAFIYLQTSSKQNQDLI